MGRGTTSNASSATYKIYEPIQIPNYSYGYNSGRAPTGSYTLIDLSSCSFGNYINRYPRNIKEDVTLYAIWNPMYYLDVNGFLDGKDYDNTKDYGTFDVYVNGVRVANDVSDYYRQHVINLSYEIKDIKATGNHSYNGVHSGSISGTMTEAKLVSLDFKTNPPPPSSGGGGGGGGDYSQQSGCVLKWHADGHCSCY